MALVRMRRALAALLCAAVFLAAPGPACWAQSAKAVVPTLGEGLLPVAPVAPAALPGALSVSPLAPLPLPSLAAPAALPTLPQPASTLQSLETGAQALGEAASPAQAQEALDGLFLGAERRGAAPESGLPDASGASGPSSSLAASSIEDDAAVARDEKRPLPERLEAVKRVAARGAEAKPALKALGAHFTEASAQDYEVIRASLRALAGLGEVVSLPPTSWKHANEILKKLEAEKPEAAAFDYDDTLEKYQEPASPETGAALKAASDQGIEVMVLTDRPDVQPPGKGASILDSLAPLTPEQKGAIVVGANRGARVLLYDRGAEARLVREEPAWTAAQRQDVLAAGEAVAKVFGRGTFNNKTEDLSEYGYALFLPVGTPAAKVNEAAGRLGVELAARGIAVEVIGRNAYKETDPPYLTLSKIDKSLGVGLLRSERRGFERLRAFLALGLPGRFIGPAKRLLERFKGSSVSPIKTLLVGDHFFDKRTVDKDMVKGAPGALAISVGGTADPRIENIVVWPEKGPAGAREILGALGKPLPPDPDFNKKAVFGLFLGRTVSIVAFVMTSVAYPFIAIPVVGVAGFGALAAFGPMAAVATGPVAGLIADKLSARKAMMLNTAISAVLALGLPFWAALGLLNFWTLLLGSVLNGWLLSSVMVTEGAFIKRLAGARNVPVVNALAQMNYLSIQVVLGLILGIGALIDGWNPMTPFYISSALSALLILPITYKTIPDITPDKQKPAPAADAPGPARRFAAFLSKHRASVLLLGAALAAHLIGFFWVAPLLPTLAGGVATAAKVFTVITPMLITGSLIRWISRTDGFKALWGQAKLKNAMLFNGLSAFLVYPTQYFALPLIALALAGAAGKSLLLGKLLGALFFGQLIGNAGQVKLPGLRLPSFLTGGRAVSVGWERVLQAFVLGLAAAWSATSLFSGSVLAALAAAALGAALMIISSKLSPVSRIKYLGVGLSFILLPLAFWGSIPALFASVLAIGLMAGPAAVAISSYFQNNARSSNLGKYIGIQGSFFNASISFGYGVLSAVAALLSPSFPGTLWFMAALFLAAAVVFYFAPRLLPGLGGPPPSDKK